MSLAAAILDAALFALSFALTHSPTLSVRCFYHFIVTLCSPRLRRLRPRARKAVASFLASADDQAAIVVLEWQDHLRQWPEHPRGVRNAVLNALVALGGILCPEAPDIAVYFPTTVRFPVARVVCTAPGCCCHLERNHYASLPRRPHTSTPSPCCGESPLLDGWGGVSSGGGTPALAASCHPSRRLACPLWRRPGSRRVAWTC